MSAPPPYPGGEKQGKWEFHLFLFLLKWFFFYFTNHETSSLLTYKDIIRNICNILEWTLGMFTEDLKLFVVSGRNVYRFFLIIYDRTCRYQCEFLDVKMNSERYNVHFSTREENDKSISAAEKQPWDVRKSVSHLSTRGLHVIDSPIINIYVSHYSMLFMLGFK